MIRQSFAFALLAAVTLAAPAMGAPGDNPGWDDVNAAIARHDLEAARQLAETLASKGDPEAINGLASLVDTGVGGPPDPARAVSLWEQASAAGSSAAKLNLARHLSRDASQAQRVLSLLQDVMKDRRIGQLGQGIYYPLGRVMIFGGHGQDELKQGLAYMKQAVTVEPNNADAQFLVARAYQSGWGGSERDPAKAFEHFLAAAKLGDERAERMVGLARLNGDGVQQDAAAAFADFMSAAEHGSVAAMIDVAVMLAIGEGGIPAEPLEALKWYRRAADLGSAHALRGLGVMLYRGEAGPADPTIGQAYLELAAAAGDGNAQKIIPEMLKPITSSQRAAVDAAKSDWLAHHPAPKPD